MKNIPLLPEEVPREQQFTRAAEIMTKDHLKFVYLESSVQQLQEVLKSGHSAFPVMNTQNNMVGMIKARFIVVLLEHKIWSDIASES
jgi:CBS domain containing-hemolysin-like protein